MTDDDDSLAPARLLEGYLAGAFPMAESGQATDIAWYQPTMRALLPLGTEWERAHDLHFHVRRSLARALRRQPFVLSWNQAFTEVIAGCAAPAPGREDTWINPMIRRAFEHLHRLGLAHSIEAWQRSEAGEPQLVGGLYGLALGRAFFAESMFSRRSNASSACLVHLVTELAASGFELLDVQYHNDHLAAFGLYEIPHADYLERLHQVVEKAVSVPPWQAVGNRAPASPRHSG